MSRYLSRPTFYIAIFCIAAAIGLTIYQKMSRTKRSGAIQPGETPKPKSKTGSNINIMRVVLIFAAIISGFLTFV